MRRYIAAVLTLMAALGAASASARQASPPSASATPSAPTAAAYPPVEYRFDHPQLLTQQLLWGIFHGVRLLGLACQARGDHAAALAYADWMDRQQPRLRAAERDLARYYYRRDSAAPEAISMALGLQPALDVPPDLLEAACNSLPEALAQERYDLDKFYLERRAAVQHGDAGAPQGIWREPEETPPVVQSPPASENIESQTKENP